MRAQRKDGRILIYSHDTFGLGHLRRCRAIAHALVERYKQLSVLILSGSPIIGSFDFRSRVDFVRVPGVIKLRNGEYTPLNLHIDIAETLSMRASIIQHTAEMFDPDLFIVDKEPVGLRGEVLPTLKALKRCRRCASSATRSGSMACRRSAIRWKASRCRRACGRRWSTPGTCIAKCPRTACRRACPRSPSARISSSPPAAAATAKR